MPSIEGTEIRIALQQGFALRQLTFVDDNPAIVAHLTRRYPGRADAIGTDVVTAFERLRSEKRFVDFANLDLCGNLSQIETVRAICKTGCFNRGALVGVTLLRGRDTPSTVREQRELLESVVSSQARYPDLPQWASLVASYCSQPDTLDGLRLFALHAAIDGIEADADVDGEYLYYASTIPLLWHVYRSNAGSQTMAWALFWTELQDQQPDEYTRHIRRLLPTFPISRWLYEHGAFAAAAHRRPWLVSQ